VPFKLRQGFGCRSQIERLGWKKSLSLPQGTEKPGGGVESSRRVQSYLFTLDGRNGIEDEPGILPKKPPNHIRNSQNHPSN
jgi:hypothetical protein